MTPPPSVSGLYFGHPQARYFSVGRIGRDQVVRLRAAQGLRDRGGRALAAARTSRTSPMVDVRKLRVVRRLLALRRLARARRRRAPRSRATAIPRKDQAGRPGAGEGDAPPQTDLEIGYAATNDRQPRVTSYCARARRVRSHAHGRGRVADLVDGLQVLVSSVRGVPVSRGCERSWRRGTSSCRRRAAPDRNFAAAGRRGGGRLVSLRELRVPAVAPTQRRLPDRLRARRPGALG